MVSRICYLFAAGVVASLALACSRPPAGWSPVVEETSTRFLGEHVARARADVRAAREILAARPAQAAARLAAAEATLRELAVYYLPLLECREHAYNAYRAFELDDPATAARLLAAIEAALRELARHSELMDREMENPMRTLKVARQAVEERSPEAARHLEALARRLNLLLLRGELVLGPGEGG